MEENYKDYEEIDETAFEEECVRCKSFHKFLIEERDKNEFKTPYQAGKFDFIERLLKKYFNE